MSRPCTAILTMDIRSSGAIGQVERLTGQTPHDVMVDQGYRGHGYGGSAIAATCGANDSQTSNAGFETYAPPSRRHRADDPDT